MLAAVAFLDAFQKVADMATNTRGGEGAWSVVGDAPSGPGGWKGIWAVGRTWSPEWRPWLLL